MSPSEAYWSARARSESGESWLASLGRCDCRPERDTVSVYDRGAFGAPFAPIHRAFARHLPATGSLRDATVVDGHAGKPWADELVVSFAGQPPKRRHCAGFDPLVVATARGGRRARLAGDPLVDATEHQDLDELLEYYPVGDARA